MKNWLTKKNVIITSGIVALLLALLLAFLPSPYRCGVYEYLCKATGGLVLNLFIVFPLFLFSLVTYFMREEVFQAWIKIARWWVLASILIVLVMPTYNGPFLPLDKGHVAVLMAALFAIASIVSILEVTVRLRSKKK